MSNAAPTFIELDMAALRAGLPYYQFLLAVREGTMPPPVKTDPRSIRWILEEIESTIRRQRHRPKKNPIQYGGGRY